MYVQQTGNATLRFVGLIRTAACKSVAAALPRGCCGFDSAMGTRVTFYVGGPDGLGALLLSTLQPSRIGRVLDSVCGGVPDDLEAVLIALRRLRSKPDALQVELLRALARALRRAASFESRCSSGPPHCLWSSPGCRNHRRGAIRCRLCRCR